MGSIRTFLIVVILSVICLSNFIAALQGYSDSLHAVDKIEEQQLEDKARALNVLFTHHSTIPENIFDDGSLFQVWQQDRLLVKSNNAPESLFYQQRTGIHLKNYDGHQWLLYGFNDPVTRLHIIVATKHRAYSSLTEDVLIRAILPIIWILPIIGILVWLIVNLGMKPLRHLAVKLASRGANDFSLLKDDQYASELLPIISSLNGLFERLAEAFERERRFSADAAHELRTPLAALKVNLHNLSKEQRDDKSWQALKRTADRMEHSIEQLLSLHKASLDIEGAELKIFDLRQAAQEVIADVYDDLVGRQQNIELIGDGIKLKGHLSSIMILLRNLIDNASKYTPDYGFIRVTINENNERVCIVIEDSGSGIPESEYARVLERFYRVGGDRNNSTVRGSGLGLSIVADILRTHEGEIVLSESSELGGLAVTISFPVIASNVSNVSNEILV